jgi:hypothetical protein
MNKAQALKERNRYVKEVDPDILLDLVGYNEME